jgi:RNA 3'-terminal phosphate cyclase
MKSIQQSGNELNERLKAIAFTVEQRLPAGVKFTLVLHTEQIGGYGGHVSNGGKNADVVARALRQAADRIEKQARAEGVAPSIVLPH